MPSIAELCNMTVGHRTPVPGEIGTSMGRFIAVVAFG